jgi:C4-dicarboxylate-specific signal transduction histidine kinase
MGFAVPQGAEPQSNLAQRCAQATGSWLRGGLASLRSAAGRSSALGALGPGARVSPAFLQSLPLRLSVLFVGLLMLAALGAGYLFDRARFQALEERSLAMLRLHGERAADNLQGHLDRLECDTLFLADSPAATGACGVLERGVISEDAQRKLAVWQVHLQNLFLAFAQSRPDYGELRFIEAGSGRNLVRVERVKGTPRVISDAATAHDRTRARVLDPGLPDPGASPASEVYDSRIELLLEPGHIKGSLIPTLRATAPVRAAQGDLAALVVVNMDIHQLLAPLDIFVHGGEKAYLFDGRGYVLLHAGADDILGRGPGDPKQLKDAYPLAAAAIAAKPPGSSGFFRWGHDKGKTVGYLASRTFKAGGPGFRLNLLLTESAAGLVPEVGAMRRRSFLWMGALLLAAAVLVGLMVGGLTRSLRALVKASEAIAAGNYATPLPEVAGGEVGALTSAFRRMAGEVRAREQARADLNEELERRVEERTEALQQQEERQRLILENIGDGVIVADRSGRFLLWNRGAERIIGTAPRAMSPHQCSVELGVFRSEAGDPLPPDELPLLRAMRGESTESAQLFVKPPGCDQGRWVMATGRPLFGSHNVVEGGVMTLIDITMRMQLNRRLEQNRNELARVGRLALTAEIAAAASHQLSQPIAAMAAYAGAAERLLQSRELGGEWIREMLTDMTRVAARASDTLASLRTLIRRRGVAPQEIDVNELVVSSLLNLEERLVEENVAVHRELGSHLPRLKGDPVELEQMLIQLVANAIDALRATPRPMRCLLISTSHHAAGGMIVIRVVDNGEGISPGQADRLFEPWVTSREDALGIGLSIARTIVENHGGRIGVELQESPGAVFKIELPTMVPLS